MGCFGHSEAAAGKLVDKTGSAAAAVSTTTARNAGIDSILVLSGEATLEDVAKEQYQPTLVLKDLGEAEKDWPGSATEAGQQDV